MATIYDLAKKYGITAKKLRKLETAGHLVCDSGFSSNSPWAVRFGIL
jgi:hypothetical protein